MKKAIITALLFFVCASAFATQFGSKMATRTASAEILFFGGFDLDKDNLPNGFKAIKSGKAGRGVEFIASSDKWKTAKIVGTVSSNKQIRMMLRSKTRKNEIVYFDNLKINGELVPNGDFSSDNFDGWYLPKNKKDIKPQLSIIPEKNGPSFCSDNGLFIARDLKLKKGEKVEISVDYLCADYWASSHPLDLSEYHNVVFGGKKSFVKNAKSPKNPRLYGGMKFYFVDKNGSPNIAYLRHSQKALLKYGDTTIQGKYLYILYTAEKFKYPQNGGVVIRVTFKDGRKISRFIKFGEDLRYYSQNVEALDNTLPVYIDNKEKNVGGVYITRVDLVGGGGPAPIDSIEIDSRLDFQILGVTLSSKEVYTTKVMKYPKSEWAEIDTESMEVKEGSALDLSYQVADHAPAGKYGRIVVGKNGTFEFEKRPNVPVRFKGANFYSLTCQIGKEIKTKAEIDDYVKMLKKQGFNALRWRFSVENKIFDKENGIKKEYWDLYDYFLYALGREGIYSYFYLASHDIGAPNFNWNERTAIKMRMMLGYPELREAWRKYAKLQLEHINPYTKLAWKDDPSIATIEYWNEFDLGFGLNSIDSKARAILTKKFQEFLKKRYKTIDAFLAYNEEIGQKWNSGNGKIIKDFKDIHFGKYYANQYHPDLGRFVIYLLQDVQNFYRKVVFEEIGMKVPTFQNNCVKNLFWTHCSVNIGSTTAINTYHDIATGFGVGAKSKQISAIHDSANYWRGALSRNVAGMPMTVTEYQHCYPNKYCHELALMFPTYSAFQDFAGLMEFDSPVAKNASVLGFKRIGVNPILRVNDFLTSFFYLRGDIKPSKNRVDIVFDNKFFQESKFASGALHQEQSKIALITGLRLSFPDVKRVPELDKVKIAEPTISYQPTGVSKLTQSFHATSLAGVWESTFSWDEVMADLKKKKILTADNRSDPKNAIFETDNKQIYMDSKNRLLQVNTPKSVGTTVNANSKDLQVGVLAVKSSSVDASVALVSLDNKKLENSSRLILTFATDAVLKSSKFSINRKHFLDFGKPPVLIKTGKLNVEIKTNGKSFVIYPLKMTGERMKKIPSKLENGVLKFAVDNHKTPALYFEIVAE